MKDPNYLDAAAPLHLLKKYGYKNPRKLPEKWIKAYLERDKEMLALDVMRAFDENADLKRRVDRYRFVNIALTSIITALAWEGVKALLLFLAHR